MCGWHVCDIGKKDGRGVRSFMVSCSSARKFAVSRAYAQNTARFSVSGAVAMPAPLAPVDDMRAVHGCGLFLELCKVSKVLPNAETFEREKMADAFKAFLRAEALSLVKSARSQPMLYSYLRHATGLLCQVVSKAALGGKVAARKGKVLCEFLTEHGFLKTVSATGEPSVAMSLKGSLPLAEGKLVRSLYSAASAFFPLLRKVGVEGIRAHRDCSDRAVVGVIDRMLSERLSHFS